MKFWQFDWRNSAEMGLEFLFSIVLTFFYLIWIAYMAAFYPVLLAFAIVIMYLIYVVTGLITLSVAIMTSERGSEEFYLLFYAPFFPLYKSFFRWVRMYSLVMEYFRINYEQDYLPESAWRSASKW